MHGETISQLLYNKKKEKKRKHMSTVYRDVPKPKSNLDLCTTLLVCHPRPGDA